MFSFPPRPCFICSPHNVGLLPSLPPATCVLPCPLSLFLAPPPFPSSHPLISSFSQCQPFCFLSPCRPHISLSPSLIFIFHIYLSFIPRLTSSSSPPSPPSPSSPLHPSFTRSPCHWAKPAYLHWNKSTSSHGHFSVVSFFLLFSNHCNPFSYQPEELIKQPPRSLSLSQCQVMDGCYKWVPAVM